MKRLLAGAALGFCLSTSAISGDFEAARNAYKAEDFRTAMELARPLAEAGDMRAKLIIGIMLINGEGVPADAERGLRLVEQAAEAAVPEAQAMMGAAILSRKFPTKNVSEAASWAEKAAAQNADAGHFLLSVIHFNGFGVPQSPPLGLDHLRRAAASGKPLARYELGKAIFFGRGTERDKVQGATMLKQVAAAWPQISEEVDLLLANADQLERLQQGEVRLTCSSFSCAGSSGWNAERLRKYMDQFMWAELAAKVLDIGDRSDLNYFYLGRALEGLGNLSAAKIYYRLALDPKQRGRPCAALVNNCRGSIFPQDINERLASVDAAEEYLSLQLKRREAERLELERIKALEAAEAARAKLLAEQERGFSILSTKAADGDHAAQYQLAYHYFEGGGRADPDPRTAIVWLTKAAEGGLAEAQFDLGRRLLNGNDINADERRAEFFLRQAEAKGHREASATLAELMRARQQAALRAEEVRQANERKRAAAAQAEKFKKAEAARRAKAEEAAAERKRRIDNAEKLKAL